LKSNLERIAATFRRPVLGIHNSTYGIIFDVVECMIQRTFGYATLDIRLAYTSISETLKDPECTKLVVVCHSQGAIELSLVLDWIFATVSREQVSKLEIYTFGNASNHWNCPESATGERVIKHTEHYANTQDWVSRFGVLHFRAWGLTKPMPVQHGLHGVLDRLKRAATGDNSPTALRNRFVGRLFLRKGSGHQMNQHYMDNIFTMNAANNKVLEGNSFMDQVIDETNLDEDHVVIAAADLSHQDVVNGSSSSLDVQPAPLIKQKSRLWAYRNGGTPKN
jgi:hypothetical protein